MQYGFKASVDPEISASDLRNRLSADPRDNYRGATESGSVSLWDMLQLHAHSLVSALTLIGSAIGNLRATLTVLASGHAIAAAMPMETRRAVLKAVEIVIENAETHDLKISLVNARRSQRTCVDLLYNSGKMSEHEIERLVSTLEGLVHAVIDEAESRKFFTMPAAAEAYHQSPVELFGGEVIRAFPDARHDIEDAGRCMAFELWTAAVMHLMRALEPALGALARHVGVEPGANWNQTLDQIEKALRSVTRRDAGVEAEEWAAEAGTQIRFIKTAWRNSAMHAGRTYDKREAQSVLETTRTLMQHLAEKLSSD